MTLAPGGLLAWIIVGAIAGWLAGHVMSGRGFGLLGDIVVGIIGAFLGEFVFSFFMVGSSAGLVGSIAIAFVGAVILLVVLRALMPKRRFGL
jgi:uncharacterized membrane protein YeaQ/YmgE (transglycosylase-associated protein family)